MVNIDERLKTIEHGCKTLKKTQMNGKASHAWLVGLNTRSTFKKVIIW